MKRFLVLLLCCAVLTATACGCGGTKPEPVTTVPTTIETITEAELTTEEETATEPLVPHPWRTPDELALSKTITVYEVFNDTKPYPGGYDIWLRDNATGEEALLLEIGGLGFSSFWSPSLGVRLSERHFTFSYYLPETCDSTGVMFYDVAQRRAIEVSSEYKLIFKKTENGRVYLCNALDYDEEDDWDKIKPVCYFDISVLDSGEPVVLSALKQ